MPLYAGLIKTFRMSGIEGQIVAVTQFCTENFWKLDTRELDGPNLLQGLSLGHTGGHRE